MKAFHAQTFDEALQNVQSTPEGLSTAEAAQRLAKNGKNALKEPKRKSLIVKFLEQFKDMMIIVLLVAAAVSAVISLAEGVYEELIDAGIILLIVIINAVIGLVQSNKAEAAMDALKSMNRPYAKVIRDGVPLRIPGEELVVGDIVLLEAGDTVPADLRLLESASLKIEEAALTGESVPSEKEAGELVAEDAPLGDRHNMAYSGGAVTYGRGKGVVVAIGMQTEMGKIAEMLTSEDAETSPLQNQLAKTAKMLSILVLGIAVVIFAVNVIRAVVGGTFSVEVLIEAFMTAVAIAVAAIPEGLPATVTIDLALGVQRMSARNAIIRNLPSVETLGCCEIICSDKTGTLTLNRMTVKGLYTMGQSFTDKTGLETDDTMLLRRTLALCNDTVEGDAESGHKLYGDPTETALVQYYKDAGDRYDELRANFPRTNELPFDSVRKCMSVLCTTDGQDVLYVKGAPDMLLERCTQIMTAEGVRPLTDADRNDILAANRGMAEQALRVLAAAVRYDIPKNKDHWEEELVFVGLVGMIDPPRPEVKDAVAVCREAGMRPLMITGDHKDTAAAIASEIGILREGEKVMTGAEIDRLSDEELTACIAQYSVFARVSPENKVRIVRAYRVQDKIVAMTGDGVNDAPSIKAADIGIGMGITGTDVSKGAADMVLADDNFATIVGAVEEGRKIYANIQKALQFLLSANIAEVLCLFIVSVFLGESFLTPVMILWVNLITDSLPALALGMEQAEQDVMKQKPRKSGGSLFAGKVGTRIILQGCMQTILVMATYLLGFHVMSAENHEVGVTMAFISLAAIQLFHAYNMRALSHSLFSRPLLANRMMNVAFVIGAVLIAIIMVIPGLRDMFGAVALNWQQLAVALGSALFIIPAVEIQKLIEKKHAK